MTLRVTEEIFTKIKQALQTASKPDIADKFQLSLSTIYRIASCDSYDDWLQNIQEGRNNYGALRESRVAELSGEELFWEVHSMLRGVPARLIHQKARQLSLEEIYRMKKASDYEEYLQRPSMTTCIKSRVRIPVEIRNEICVAYKEGMPIVDLAQKYGYEYEDIQRVLDSGPSTERQREKLITNKAIADIIIDGTRQGLSYKKMSEELGISIATVSRVTRNKHTHSKSDAIFEQWSTGHLSTRDIEFYREEEDFYLFSLRKYLGKDDYPFWWNPNQRRELLNKGAFEIIRYGVNLVGIDTIAEQLKTDKSFVQQVMGSEGKREPASVYDMRTDRVIFTRVKRGVPCRQLLPQDREDMLKHETFTDYILYLMFGDNIPDWAKKPETDAEKTTLPTGSTEEGTEHKSGTEVKPISPEVNKEIPVEPLEEATTEDLESELTPQGEPKNKHPMIVDLDTGSISSDTKRLGNFEKRAIIYLLGLLTVLVLSRVAQIIFIITKG